MVLTEVHLAEDKVQTEAMSCNHEARVEALQELCYQLAFLEDFDALKRVLNETRPADLADLMRRLDDEIREKVFDLLEESLLK